MRPQRRRLRRAHRVPRRSGRGPRSAARERRLPRRRRVGRRTLVDGIPQGIAQPPRRCDGDARSTRTRARPWCIRPVSSPFRLLFELRFPHLRPPRARKLRANCSPSPKSWPLRQAFTTLAEGGEAMYADCAYPPGPGRDRECDPSRWRLAASWPSSSGSRWTQCLGRGGVEGCALSRRGSVRPRARYRALGLAACDRPYRLSARGAARAPVVHGVAAAPSSVARCRSGAGRGASHPLRRSAFQGRCHCYCPVTIGSVGWMWSGRTSVKLDHYLCPSIFESMVLGMRVRACVSVSRFDSPPCVAVRPVTGAVLTPPG